MFNFFSSCLIIVLVMIFVPINLRFSNFSTAHVDQKTTKHRGSNENLT